MTEVALISLLLFRMRRFRTRDDFRSASCVKTELELEMKCKIIIRHPRRKMTHCWLWFGIFSNLPYFWGNVDCDFDVCIYFLIRIDLRSKLQFYFFRNPEI